MHPAAATSCLLVLGLYLARGSELWPLTAPGRALMGVAVDLTEEEKVGFQLSGDEEILFQSRSNCEEGGSVMDTTSNRLLCGWSSSARDCLKVSNSVPIWIGRDCKGQVCLAKNTPAETLCLLRSYGLNLDPKNATRKATCGFTEEDRGWLQPSINPATQTTPDGKPSCSVVTPEGVVSEVWADCINGIPELRYRLTFSSKWNMGNRNYKCQINPRCTKDLAFKSTLLCHRTGIENEAPEDEDIDLDTELEDDKEIAVGLSRHSLWAAAFFVGIYTVLS